MHHDPPPRTPSQGSVSGNSFAHYLARLNHAQKPGHGVPAYTRWVNRRAARYFAAGFMMIGLAPSTVSTISLLTSLAGIGAFLALHAEPVAAGTVAAVLLALGYVLDSADGQLARLQRSSSLRGEWLDHSLDAIRLPLVHLSIAAGFLLADAPALAAVAALYSVSSSATFLSQNVGLLLRGRASAPLAEARRYQSWMLLPIDPGVLCWSFILWPVSWLFRAVYLFLFTMNLMHAVSSARRRWGELAEDH